MRDDLSDRLCHWVKANSNEEAFEILAKIIRERRIVGANGFVRGNHKCICFTETPEIYFHKEITRYKKFGVSVSKQWAFDQGARPVIYQPKSEFDLLPNDLKWRHVTYEPPGVDFMWEREWRMNSPHIEIDPFEMVLLVPDDEFGECLFSEYIDEQYRTCISAVPEKDWESWNLIPKPCRYRVV